jgi:hypothetical protein
LDSPAQPGVVEDTQHRQSVIVIACVISIIGGLAGAWASWTKDEDAARAVWLVLITGSFAVALWNLKVGFLDTPGGAPFGTPGISIFWSAGYAAAYHFRFVKDKFWPRVNADRNS